MSQALTYQDRSELIRRIEELENAEVNVANSSLATLNRSTGRVDSTLPALTGLSAGKVVGAVSFFWTASTIAIDYYEVQIATDALFLSPVTRNTTGTDYVYSDGDLGTTYYVRVRSVRSGGVSAWSAVLDTTSGIAVAGDIAATAASNPAVNRVTTFSPSDLQDPGAAPEVGTYGSATITVRDNEVVWPFVTSQADYSITGIIGAGDGGRITLELLRDDGTGPVVMGDSFENDIYPEIGTISGTMSPAGFLTPDVPGAGTYTYSVRWTVEALRTTAGAISITPVFQNLELVGFPQGR